MKMKTTMSNPVKTTRIEIAPSTVFMIIGILIGGYLLYSLRDVVMMIFIAIIIASAVIGPVGRLTDRKIPRWLAVTILYIGVLGILTLILSLASVPFARQTILLFENLPGIFTQLAEFLNSIGEKVGLEQEILQTEYIRQVSENLYGYVSDNLGNVLSIGAQGITGVFQIFGQVFGGVFTFISILTISVYIVYDYENLLTTATQNISDKKFQARVRKLLMDMQHKLGGWLRGQITVGLISGTLTWIALTLLQLPYALPLACITAILVNIPVFGATLSAVPAIIVALTGGNIIQIIGVPMAYIIIQQIENNIVAPRVMSNAIGVRPLVVILSILIGAELAGFLGVIVAVPVAGIIQLSWEFAMELRENGKKN